MMEQFILQLPPPPPDPVIIDAYYMLPWIAAAVIIGAGALFVVAYLVRRKAKVTSK